MPIVPDITDANINQIVRSLHAVQAGKAVQVQGATIDQKVHSLLGQITQAAKKSPASVFRVAVERVEELLGPAFSGAFKADIDAAKRAIESVKKPIKETTSQKQRSELTAQIAALVVIEKAVLATATSLKETPLAEGSEYDKMRRGLAVKLHKLRKLEPGALAEEEGKLFGVGKLKKLQEAAWDEKDPAFEKAFSRVNEDGKFLVYAGDKWIVRQKNGGERFGISLGWLRDLDVSKCITQAVMQECQKVDSLKSEVLAFERNFYKLPYEEMQLVQFDDYNAKHKLLVQMAASFTKKYPQIEFNLVAFLPHGTLERLQECVHPAIHTKAEADELLETIDAKEGTIIVYLDAQKGVHCYEKGGQGWPVFVFRFFQDSPSLLLPSYVEAYTRVRHIIKEGAPLTASDRVNLESFLQAEAAHIQRYETSFLTRVSTKADLQQYKLAKARFNKAYLLLQPDVPEHVQNWPAQRFEKLQPLVERCHQVLEWQTVKDSNDTTEACPDLLAMREQILQLNAKELELLKTPLKQRYGNENVEALFFSLNYETNPAHLAKTVTVLAIPAVAHTKDALDALTTCVDDVEFAKGELDILGCANMAAVKKSVADFVTIVKTRQVRMGTPAAGSSALDEFYQMIEHSFIHALNKLTELKEGTAAEQEKAKKQTKEMVREIVRAVGMCGPRHQALAISQYRQVAKGEKPPGLEEQILELAAGWRDIGIQQLASRRAQEAAERVKKIPAERIAGQEFDDQEFEDFHLAGGGNFIHYVNALIMGLGQELGIVGYNLVQDPLATKIAAEKLTHDKERFLIAYNGHTIVSNLREEARGLDFRNACIDWHKANMPFKWADTEYEPIIAHVRQIWNTAGVPQEERYTQAVAYLMSPEVGKIVGEEFSFYIDQKISPHTLEGLLSEIEGARQYKYITREVLDLSSGKPTIHEKALCSMLTQMRVLQSTAHAYEEAEFERLSKFDIAKEDEEAFIKVVASMIERVRDNYALVSKWVKMCFAKVLKRYTETT